MNFARMLRLGEDTHARAASTGAARAVAGTHRIG